MRPMPYDAKALDEHKARMTRGEGVPVSLVSHYGQRTKGTLRRVVVSEDEANAPARRWLLGACVVAPVTFVFPPHVPWPLLVLAIGIIGYFLQKGTREQVLGGEGDCPKCGAFQIIEGGNAEFPMAHFCTECRERSLVEPS